jgi:signal transduction histidine kinase/ActR/RegA family two-component response regulator/HPt (histidine-containing phosphotransfer) domain-containing protein
MNNASSASSAKNGQIKSVWSLRRATASLLGLIVLFACFFGWDSYRRTKQDSINELMTVMELSEKAVDTFATQIELAIRNLSLDLLDSNVDGSIDIKRATQLVRRFNSIHTELSSVLLIRADGQMLASSTALPGAKLPSVADSEAFRVFLKEERPGQIDVSRAFVGPVVKKWILAFRYGIHDESGELKYYVSATLPVEFLQSFWKDAPITARASLGLVRDDAYLISRYPVPSNDFNSIYGEPRSGSLMGYLFANQFPQSGFVEGPSSIEGGDMLTAFRRLSHHPITLFIVMPQRVVWLAWWSKIDAACLLIVLLIVGIIVGFRITDRRNLAHELERKDFETDLIRSKEAALAGTRAKSEFLANMSHEIRTPINGVMGMTDLLLETGLSAEQRDYAGNIKTSSEALLTIINDILDFSKVEAGKLDIEILDFDLSNLLSDLDKIFYHSAGHKGLKFQTQWPKVSHPVFKGDIGRIRQVLTNLVGNAIKFTKSGDVGLRLTILSDTTSAVQFKFEVSDTGIGIPESARARMFQSFSQADSSVTRRFGGTGLGLSISKHLIELMGGEIGLESEEGKGSTFWFTLNLEKSFATIARETSVDSLQVLAPGTKRSRILLAEDNVVNQKLAVVQLNQLGYKVDVVGSGGEVLDALRNLTYALVLMDCQMPEMDGFEATRKIRASETLPNATIPIVALTANALKGDKERCLEAGMNDYLSKPFTKRDLQTVIAKWTGEDAIQGGSPFDAILKGPELTMALPTNLPVLDASGPEFLQGLAGGEDTIVIEIANELLGSLPKDIIEIKTSFEAKNATKVAAIAHRVKSGCAAFGAKRLAAAFERLETQGKAADFNAVALSIPVLETEFVAFRTEVSRRFKVAA